MARLTARRGRRVWAVSLALGLATGAGPVRAGERRALVIGNAAYEPAPMPRARADAELVGEALLDAGFEVVFVYDADRGKLERAISFFDETIQPGDVALFFFAGEAARVGDSTHLLPVGGAPDDETARDGLGLGEVLDRLAASGPEARVLIIDARVRSGPLGPPSVPDGALVAQWAGAEDETSGEPGTFGRSLARHLTTRGITAEELFAAVQEELEGEAAASAPIVVSSLPPGIELAPSPVEPSSSGAAPPGGAVVGGAQLDAPGPPMPRLLDHEEPWFPLAGAGVATLSFSLLSALPIGLAFQQPGCEVNGECPLQVNYVSLGIGLAMFASGVIAGGVLLGVADHRRKDAALARGVALGWRGPGRGLAF